MEEPSEFRVSERDMVAKDIVRVELETEKASLDARLVASRIFGQGADHRTQSQ